MTGSVGFSAGAEDEESLAAEVPATSQDVDDSSPSIGEPETSPSAEWATAEKIRRARRLWRLRHYEDGTRRHRDDVADLFASDRQLCAQKPLEWIRNYGILLNPKAAKPSERRLPFVLWPSQVELAERALKAKAEQSTLVANKGRELGVTWLFLHLIAHGLLFEDGFSAQVGSRKEEYVDDRTARSLFGKLRWILKAQPRHLLPSVPIDDVFSRLSNPERGSVVTGESTNADWGRSGRHTVVFLDEFARIEPRLQEEIWTGMESVAGCKWVVSTPNGRGNKFHYLLETLDAPRKATIDWRADPRRDDAWFERLLVENGGDLTWDEREQEHGASFAGVSGERIWRVKRERTAYTEAELPPFARERWIVAGGMDFGSGPSLTVAGLALVDWGDPPTGRPRLWVDSLRFWERQPSSDIATDLRGALSEYHGPRILYGDPSGKAAQHDQESWESSLRAGGVPLYCLPASFNDPFIIRKSLEEVQSLLDLGYLRIHAERCKVLLEAIESWEWDLPRGIPLKLVSKEQIHPRKDGWSHFGDMLRYLVAAVLRLLRPNVGRPAALSEGLANRPRSISSDLSLMGAALDHSGQPEDLDEYGPGWA